MKIQHDRRGLPTLPRPLTSHPSTLRAEILYRLRAARTYPEAARVNALVRDLAALLDEPVAVVDASLWAEARGQVAS